MTLDFYMLYIPTDQSKKDRRLKSSEPCLSSNFLSGLENEMSVLFSGWTKDGEQEGFPPAGFLERKPVCFLASDPLEYRSNREGATYGFGAYYSNLLCV